MYSLNSGCPTTRVLFRHKYSIINDLKREVLSFAEGNIPLYQVESSVFVTEDRDEYERFISDVRVINFQGGCDLGAVCNSAECCAEIGQPVSNVLEHEPVGVAGAKGRLATQDHPAGTAGGESGLRGWETASPGQGRGSLAAGVSQNCSSDAPGSTLVQEEQVKESWPDSQLHLTSCNQNTCNPSKDGTNRQGRVDSVPDGDRVEINRTREPSPRPQREVTTEILNRVYMINAVNPLRRNTEK